MLCVQNSFSESVTGPETDYLGDTSYFRTVQIAVYTKDTYGLQFCLMLNRFPEKFMGTFYVCHFRGTSIFLEKFPVFVFTLLLLIM